MSMISINRLLRKYFIYVSISCLAVMCMVSVIVLFMSFKSYKEEEIHRSNIRTIQYLEILLEDEKIDNKSLDELLKNYLQDDRVNINIYNKDTGLHVTSINNFDFNNEKLKKTDLKFARKSITKYTIENTSGQKWMIEFIRFRSLAHTDTGRKFLRGIFFMFLISIVIFMVFSIILSWAASKTFLKPIHTIKRNIQKLEYRKSDDFEKIESKTKEIFELAESLEKVAEKIDEQEKLRKQLTVDMAHELRTPLATIKGNFEAMIDGIVPITLEKIAMCNDEIIRLTRLIKDLDDLNKLENKAIKLNSNELNLTELITSVVENFIPVLTSKNISVEKNIEENIKFYGDKDRLTQTIVNVLSNAAKYTGYNGKILVKLFETNESEIYITIKDNGPGIPQNDLVHIFERFYRADKSRNKNTGGKGIGLTISKAIVEAHGGSIDVLSEYGTGTEVIINLHNISKFSS